MNLDTLGKYKNTIISEFLNSQSIIDILLPNPDIQYEIDDQLLGNEQLGLKGLMFPFEYIPDIIDTKSTFICTEIIAQIKNTNVCNMTVYVYAFTHKSNMRYKRSGAIGTRIDILVSDIDKLLNGNSNFGIGKLNLERVDIYIPEKDFYGRRLMYSVPEFNRQSGT